MVQTPRLLRAAALLSVFASSAHAQDDLPLDKLLSTEISTASKYAQTVAQAPASVSIISADDIRRFGWETLADVMQSVRGFYTSYDRNYHYVGVRGFSRPTDYNNRLLLLVNGHPLNENVFGSAPFGTDLAIDLDALERIEIVRGPGSSLYGTGAMLAVVNLITRTGAATDGGRASILAGSLGKKRGAVYAGGELRNETDVAVSAMLMRTRGRDVGFAEYDGAAAHDLDFDDASGVLATVRMGRLRMMVNSVTRDKGIPTGAFGVDFGHPDSHSIDERTFGELSYEREFGPSGKLTARGFVHNYHYDGVYPYDGVRWLDRGDGRWWGGEVQGRVDLRSNHRLTGGIQHIDNRESSYHFNAENEGADGFSLPFRVLSVYVEDEYQPRENLSFRAGIRYDDYSHVRDVFSPRAAMIWEPARGSALKVIYGRAYRAPSTYELAYVDPFGGVQGNPALGAEKIDTWEVMFERRMTDALYAVVDAFAYEMRDLVDPRETDGTLRFENIGKARTRGIEAEVQGRYPNLSLYASAAYLSTDDLTNSPRRLAKVGASSALGERIEASVETIVEASRLTIRGTETDRVFLANARVGVTLPRSLHLSMVVRNLFNTAYVSPAGYEHLQDVIRQDGRTITLKLEKAF